MIGIVDYGLGNLRSVLGAFLHIGVQAVVSSEVSVLSACSGLVLPGVGAFGDGMNNLRSLGLAQALDVMVKGDRKPILGICLGAQLLARESFEFGHHTGLGWLPFSVRRLEPRGEEVRIPHVGWNSLKQLEAHFLFEGIPDDALFYYVHSYRLVSSEGGTEGVVGICDYGEPFCAVASLDNVHAVQFHPEKSQKHGLSLLANFARSVAC